MSIKDSIKCELDSTAIVDINLKIVSASNRLSVPRHFYCQGPE
ncbi:hypothetical protein OROHE_005879 [Orobanche hederae]